MHATRPTNSTSSAYRKRPAFERAFDNRFYNYSYIYYDRRIL